MEQVQQLFYIGLIELLALALASQAGKGCLKLLVLSQLLLIYGYSQVLVDYGIGISNMGNVFFAVAVSALVLIYLNYGIAEVKATILQVVIVVLVFVSLRYYTVELNSVNPDEAVTLAYKEALMHISSVFFASLGGFGLSAFVLVEILEKLKTSLLVKYFTGVLTLEIIDSLIFFPVAFGFNPEVFNLFMTGFIVKMVIHTALLPVVIFLRK